MKYMEILDMMTKGSAGQVGHCSIDHIGDLLGGDTPASPPKIKKYNLRSKWHPFLVLHLKKKRNIILP